MGIGEELAQEYNDRKRFAAPVPKAGTFSSRERDILVQAVGLHMDYIRGTGIFEERERVDVPGRPFEWRPKVKALAVEQMRTIVEMEALRERLMKMVRLT